MQVAFGLVVIFMLHIEQMNGFLERVGIHDLGNSARTCCVVEHKNSIGAVFNHLLLAQYDVFGLSAFGLEIEWADIQHIVIDQDAVFVASETYGEVIRTRVFNDFCTEQELNLWVCNKADPESKGPILYAYFFYPHT